MPDGFSWNFSCQRFKSFIPTRVFAFNAVISVYWTHK